MFFPVLLRISAVIRIKSLYRTSAGLSSEWLSFLLQEIITKLFALILSSDFSETFIQTMFRKTDGFGQFRIQEEICLKKPFFLQTSRKSGIKKAFRRKLSLPLRIPDEVNPVPDSDLLTMSGWLSPASSLCRRRPRPVSWNTFRALPCSV